MASSFVNFFSGNGDGGGHSNGQGGQGGTLLSDWNSYSAANTANNGADVEGGGGSFTKALESSASSLFTAGSSSFRRAASAASGLSASTTSFMPSQKQWAYFAGFLASGLFFLSLAIFVFLPLLVIAPAKFATSFTLGCVCVMASFFALRGWKQQLLHLTERERLPFTRSYLGSICATLYASLWLKSYILSIAFSAVQVFSLLYYVSSYFPGGSQGMKMMLSGAGNGFYSLVSAVFSR